MVVYPRKTGRGETFYWLSALEQQGDMGNTQIYRKVCILMATVYTIVTLTIFMVLAYTMIKKN